MDKRIIKQLAIDFNVKENVIQKSGIFISDLVFTDKSSHWLNTKASGWIVTTGVGNLIATCKPELRSIFDKYLGEYAETHFHFDMCCLYRLNSLLKDAGYKLRASICEECWTYEAGNVVIDNKNNHNIERFEDFEAFRHNANYYNCFGDIHPEDDRFAYGVVNENHEVVGLASVSSDSKDIWQIGVDVIRDYRNKGIAKAVVTSAMKECLDSNKIPLYCINIANVTSKLVAISCGFKPSWIMCEIEDYKD